MTGTSQPGDLYDLLGVRRDAPAGEITRAYHRRARALHPDTQPGSAAEATGFRALEQAYRVLHDPARRAAYDQALRQPAARSRPPRWPAGRLPGPTLRAGPVQIIPPAGGSPGPRPAGTWLAALADYLGHYRDGGAGPEQPW